MKLLKIKSRTKLGKSAPSPATSPPNNNNNNNTPHGAVDQAESSPPPPQSPPDDNNQETTPQQVDQDQHDLQKEQNNEHEQSPPQETRQDEKPDMPQHPPKTPLRPLHLGSFNFDSNDNTTTNNSTVSYTYPSLFQEANSMLQLANLMYTLTELRDLARNGVLNDPTKSFRILQLPLPMETANTIIVNEAILLKEVLSDGKHDVTLSALQSLLEGQKAAKKRREEEDGEVKENGGSEQQLQNTGSGGGGGSNSESDSMFGGWLESWNGCLAGGFSFDELFCGGDLGMVDGGRKEAAATAAAPSSPSPSAQVQGKINAREEEGHSEMIVAVGDMKSREELVYAVCVNHEQERITVCFRGSATKNDFLTDSRIHLKMAPDPRTESTDMVGIHQGLYDSMFGGTEKGKQSKYAEIMTHVQKLFDESPIRRKHYKLYVTGHGSGGALATLFGFYASAASLPLPITIVSIASPRVGNLAFARTFTEFESQGKIRHLRVACEKDPVTMGPTVSSKRGLNGAAKTFSPLGYLALKATGRDAGDEAYHHTGIKMALSNEGGSRCELSYSGAFILSGLGGITDENEIGAFNGSIPSGNDYPLVTYHYGAAYREQMETVETDLGGLMLNDVYREKTANA